MLGFSKRGFFASLFACASFNAQVALCSEEKLPNPSRNLAEVGGDLTQLPSEEIVCAEEKKKLGVTRCNLLSKKLQLFVLFNPLKEDAKPDDEITFHIRVFGSKYKNNEIEKLRKGHWLGFGFSKNGSMKGADMAVLRQMTSSNSDTVAWDVQDYFAEGFSRPILDAKQNYKLVSAADTAVDGLHFQVTRQKETCDYFFDEQFMVNDIPFMMWAYGSDAYTNGKFWSYHGPNSRGTQVVSLFDVSIPAIPANAEKVAVLMGKKKQRAPLISAG